MSGLLDLPGSRPRAIFLEIGEHDPRFIVPLVFGEMEGLHRAVSGRAATSNGRPCPSPGS
jgi:hypothetical protein